MILFSQLPVDGWFRFVDSHGNPSERVYRKVGNSMYRLTRILGGFAQPETLVIPYEPDWSI